uniref:RNA helicase n=1 Tax=Mesocestoides corti TaxID=53468 RepID=A0A5K3FYE0_MESCO
MLKNTKINLEECEEDIVVSEDVQVIPSFKKMHLKAELLRGIYEYGFEKPSLVQQRAIGEIMKGRDVVVQAQSGTGKTATFCIGTLQRMECSRKETQALFIAPTRELASQIHQVTTALADYLSVKCTLCCGGKNNVGEMTKSVERGSQIVVGTPGRLLELVRNGCLKLSFLRVVVVDEADEMLNQGLRDQLEQILRRLPAPSSSSVVEFEGDSGNAVVKSPVQKVVVSATWTSGCRDMLQQFLTEPVCILVPRDELSLSGIAQYYISTGGEEWKFGTLTDIFASTCVAQTVVFVRTRRKVDWLSERLRNDGFAVTAAHGDMDQATRDHVMKQFRAGRSRILVTTDIWARGIDVQTVGLVINYDLPQTAAMYLHRIGRSGRFGRRGLAISFVSDSADMCHLKNIARIYSISIDPAPANLAEPEVILNAKKQFPQAAAPSVEVAPGKEQEKSTSSGSISASRKRKMRLKRNRLKRRKVTAKKQMVEKVCPSPH